MNELGRLRVFAKELRASPALVVGVVKAGADGAAEQGNFPSGKQARTLPYIFGDEQLRMLSPRKVIADHKCLRGSVGSELQHLDGVAEIEVEDFIGSETVYLGESIGFEQIVNAGAGLPWASVARWKRGLSDGFLGTPGLDEGSTFAGMRLEVEKLLDLVCGHREIIAEEIRESLSMLCSGNRMAATVSIGTGVSLSQFAVLGEAMFEESLIESTGRIRTRSKWFAIGSFLLQAAILTLLILIPYFHPAALPKQALTLLLVAPPPPMAHADLPTHAVVAHAAAPVMLSALTAPSKIPQHAAMNVADTAAPSEVAAGFEHNGDGNGVMDALGKESLPPPPVVTAAKTRSGPLRISAGVATGRLLAPIQPIYPVIAKTARIQGTVVVEAVISRQGTVENLRVVSGPPMLAQAALSAIALARYEPYRLNGEPVEVETTINVVFRLDQ